MIGRRAAGSPPGCSRRRRGCGSPAPSAGWSGGWSGGWWGGSPGRGRPPCGGMGGVRGRVRGRVRTPLACADSRFGFLPDVVGHLLHVAPLVAAADDEPDEEQQEQQEEDGADDRAHDHAHFVGGCRGEGADGLKAQGGRTSCSR